MKQKYVFGWSFQEVLQKGLDLADLSLHLAFFLSIPLSLPFSFLSSFFSSSSPTHLSTYPSIYLPLSSLSFSILQLLFFLPRTGTSILGARRKRTHAKNVVLLKVRRAWIADGFLVPNYLSYISHFVKNKYLFLFKWEDIAIFEAGSIPDSNLLMSLVRSSRKDDF